MVENLLADQKPGVGHLESDWKYNPPMHRFHVRKVAAESMEVVVYIVSENETGQTDMNLYV